MRNPVNRPDTHRLLDGLASFRGPLSAPSKARLRTVIEAPSSETLGQAYSLVLTPEGLTLWHAVAVVDPTFPVKGPGSDAQGRRRPWPRVPDQLGARDPSCRGGARQPAGRRGADGARPRAVARRPLTGPQLARGASKLLDRCGR